jgi:hypothetical protein
LKEEEEEEEEVKKKHKYWMFTQYEAAYFIFWLIYSTSTK